MTGPVNGRRAIHLLLEHMAHRLEEQPRTVSWTTERKALIGYHDCYNCGTETPSPTDDVIVKYLQHCQTNSFSGEYLWPGESWLPSGWTKTSQGLLCIACNEAVQTALAARRKR